MLLEEEKKLEVEIVFYVLTSVRGHEKLYSFNDV